MDTLDISVYIVKEPFKLVKGYDGSKEKQDELLDGVKESPSACLCENEVCQVQRYPDGSLMVAIIENNVPSV